MKSTIKLSIMILAATALAILPVRAADDATTTTNSVPVKPKRHAAQFSGTILSVDPTAMTLTLKGRSADTTVKITSKTRIKKDKEPATFEDATVGLHARGSGVKDADGVWTAHTLNLTTPKTATPPATPPAPSGSADQK